MEDTILVTRSSMPPIEEYIEEIRPLWESHWLTNMGVKHEELRLKLKEYLGVSEIELFTNGHMALELSLQALEMPKGAEVITTPFTFASTVHAIVRNGLKPVFCDINPVNFTIDVSKIESLITRHTTCILPVHVYGNICDLKSLDEIANKVPVRVVYDAAHTFGVTINGVSPMVYGDISCLSFHATKVYNTIEGGAACFNNPVFGRRLYNLKNFGYRNAEEVEAVGANAKMNEFCAAMGLCNLRHVDEDIKKRRLVAEKYYEQLYGIPGITLNYPANGVSSNYAYFPVLFDEKKFGADRDGVFKALKAAGVHARKYFYPLVTDYTCYRNLYDSSKTPCAKKVSREVLTLPIYPDLPLKEVERICGVILKCRLIHPHAV